jgi:DNA-binding Lrp family transcriptional regulator
MAMVFVLVNSDLGAEQQVLTALQAIEGVQETYLVYGVYDILAKVEVASTALIKTVVLEQIRAISEVRDTLTLVVVEAGA